MFGWHYGWPYWIWSLFQVFIILPEIKCCKISQWQILLCFYQGMWPWKPRTEIPKSRGTSWIVEFIILNNYILLVSFFCNFSKILFSYFKCYHAGKNHWHCCFPREALPYRPCYESSFSVLPLHPHIPLQIFCIREYVHYYLCLHFLYHTDWLNYVCTFVSSIPSTAISPVSCKLLIFSKCLLCALIWEMVSYF